MQELADPGGGRDGGQVVGAHRAHRHGPGRLGAVRRGSGPGGAPGRHALIGGLRFLPAVRRLIDKSARVLIRDGQVQHNELRRSGLMDGDLRSLLRRHGHLEPDTARLAIFERRGAVSIVAFPVLHLEEAQQ